jgi:hypothetical protein
MAAEFPHVQFRSIDIAPIMAHAPRSNILFEVYDIGEGLLLEDGSQDIVFINVAIELVGRKIIQAHLLMLTRTRLRTIGRSFVKFIGYYDQAA